MTRRCVANSSPAQCAVASDLTCANRSASGLASGPSRLDDGRYLAEFGSAMNPLDFKHSDANVRTPGDLDTCLRENKEDSRYG